MVEFIKRGCGGVMDVDGLICESIYALLSEECLALSCSGEEIAMLTRYGVDGLRRSGANVEVITF